jgi:hypothetical protein
MLHRTSLSKWVCTFLCVHVVDKVPTVVPGEGSTYHLLCANPLAICTGLSVCQHITPTLCEPCQLNSPVLPWPWPWPATLALSPLTSSALPFSCS